MIGLSYFLGERHRERTTGEPYESGIVPTGSARIRFNANFYLIAVFFVIFDLETLFIIYGQLLFGSLAGRVTSKLLLSSEFFS